jgi:predicted nuclease of predicted toxin-antitoxin system
MNFLVDAQLPRRLARILASAGHDALHTLDLSRANRTTDAEINAISLRQKRVVITKDADFVDSFLLSKEPYKLLLVSTGNTRTKTLKRFSRP